MEEKSRDWKKKSIETTHTLEETLARYNKQQSKLESLKILQSAMMDMVTVSAK